jgi:hypothetical protein
MVPLIPKLNKQSSIQLFFLRSYKIVFVGDLRRANEKSPGKKLQPTCTSSAETCCSSGSNILATE